MTLRNMRIRLLVPSIAALPTGGNIFNDLLEQSLVRFVSVESVPLDDLDVAADPEAVWLADSLLFNDRLVSLRRNHPDAVLIGLIHYLHLIDPRFETGEKARAERVLLPLVDGFITTSGFTANALVEAGVEPDRILVAEPGLESAFRNAILPRDERGFVEVLTVASLLPDKGLLDCAQALAGCSDRKWRWTLVGSDRLDPKAARDALREIRSLVGADQFSYLGELGRQALADRYRKADLFLLCSRFESCGMVVREAMGAGLPTVAYRVGGLAEQIRSAEEGVLVEPGAVRQVTAALEALLRDGRLRYDMGTSAAARAEAFPTWTETARTVFRFLSGLSRSQTG